jgi:hypothetical protein
MSLPNLIHILIIFLLLTTIYCESLIAELDMQVFPAFGNYQKQDRWLPFRILVTNTAGEFDGEVVVEIQSSYSESKHSYSTPISVFGNTKKAKYLYVYPDSIQKTISFKLKDRQGNVAIEKEFHFDVIPSENKLIAIVDRSTNIQIPVISDSITSEKFYFAAISAETLPDKWKGYDSVDAVVVGDISTDALSKQQEKALIGWICGGGTLIVSGGANAQNFNDTFIKKLLPVEIYGTSIINSIPSIAKKFGYDIAKTPIVVASSKLIGDSKIILAEDDGMPVIAERKIGSGKCVFLKTYGIL